MTSKQHSTRPPDEWDGWLAEFWRDQESGLKCSCSGDCDKQRVAAALRIRELEEQLEATRQALEAVGDYAFGTWEFDDERLAAGRKSEEMVRAVLFPASGPES